MIAIFMVVALSGASAPKSVAQGPPPPPHVALLTNVRNWFVGLRNVGRRPSPRVSLLKLTDKGQPIAALEAPPSAASHLLLLLLTLLVGALALFPERLGAKWWETLSSADKAQLLLKETAKAP